MIGGKVRNCRVLLRRDADGSVAWVVGQLAELARRAEEASRTPELLGIEGAAARLYIDAFPQLVSRAARGSAG